MVLSDYFFVGFSAVLLLAAFLAVWLKNVFYNALALILCLFCVAALFIFLNSEFLAVMEVIIYIGAISIAIIFAIMLSRPMFQTHEKRNPLKLARSVLVGGLLFLALSKVIKTSSWPSITLDGDYSMRGIGKNLLTTSLLPFELISLVLLIAIIGALVISSGKENR